MSFSCKDLVTRLSDGVFQDRRVVIEFKCGTMKKATGGKLIAVGNECPNYIELVPATEGGVIKVKALCPGGGVNIEFVNRLLIPLENVCSVERPGTCQ